MVSSKDLEVLESSLKDLTNKVSALKAASETATGAAAAASSSSGAAAASSPSVMAPPPLPAPAVAPPAFSGGQRQRLPSVFAATSAGDLAMLNRCYKPNIFGWDKCNVGVHDDVDELQLRIAYRLRAREEALKKQDLEALKGLQAGEMRDCDEFMQSFDAQQYMHLAPPSSLQGPMHRRTAGSALTRSASAAAAAPCKTSNAGPLPSRSVADDDRTGLSQWPPLRPPPLAGRSGWELSDELLRARPETRLQPACWSPALADILAAAPGGFGVPPAAPAAWPRF